MVFVYISTIYILKYLTNDDDEDDENPKPCPYCGEIIYYAKEMVRHLSFNSF
jgi:hypothetical protein